MAVTDQELANAARDSLARILTTDTSSWSEGDRRQQQLEIDKLDAIISRYEAKASRSQGRSIFVPIRRVDQ